jgi:hypothetical protein
MQGFANGGAYGVVTALQGMLGTTNTCTGAGTCVPFRAQNYFEVPEYEASVGLGYSSPLWGMFVDLGGASSVTNASNFPFNANGSPRPTALGVYLDNQTIIGPQIACPISGATGNAAYTLPTNNNNVLTYTGVPHIYSFCFQSASVSSNYSMMLVNTDVANTYPLTFAGAYAPTTNVTVQQLAPSSPTAVNEAGPVPTWTGQTAATVVLTNQTGQSMTGGITLPVNSVTVLTFSAGSAADGLGAGVKLGAGVLIK